MALFAAPPVSAYCTNPEGRRDDYVSGVFGRTCGNLTGVPRDIPAGAHTVSLYGNQITHLPANAFSHLHLCGRLNLASNNMTTIELGAFNGLYSLFYMDLEDNRLGTLDSRVLMNLPRPLQLRPSNPDREDQPWSCDTLCWMKQEEQQGSITWYNARPRCHLPHHWHTLQCKQEGIANKVMT